MGDDRLFDDFMAVRAASERLAAPLSAEDCALQSMADASPTKWHLAHTTWYFETFVLEDAIDGYRPFEPAYRELFNSYYHSVGKQYARPNRGLLSRPTLDEVNRYRRHVDALMGDLLEKADTLPVTTRDVIELGIHHEQQHQELILTDVKHALACNPLRPAYDPKPPPARAVAPARRWLAYEGGVREMGHAGDGFAFDNEGPRHRVFVEDFELASRPVTNGEFVEFVSEGGYSAPLHWMSDGWATAQEQGWVAPLYWERDDDGWQMLTLRGTQPLRLEDPVCHVSWYEADAYARWAGARLPTEAEWEGAALGAAIEGNFVESGRLQPAAAEEGDGPVQLFGDVWEWTGSAYGPYPGYRPAEGAIGEYNGKFMSNQLTLRGGSCATPRAHMRPTYRNFFYPHSRWQFSGVRLAR